MIIDVEDRLEPGERRIRSISPITERRDACLRDDEDRREYWERQRGWWRARSRRSKRNG
jgi:hypothetical protein